MSTNEGDNRFMVGILDKMEISYVCIKDRVYTFLYACVCVCVCVCVLLQRGEWHTVYMEKGTLQSCQR